MTKEPGARGGSPDRCVCPRLPPWRVTHLSPALPSLLGVVIQISKGACLLSSFPSFRSKLPFLGPPPDLHPHGTQGTSHAGSWVSMATRGRVFAYYTLCVTSRLVMYAPCRCGGTAEEKRVAGCVGKCVRVRPRRCITTERGTGVNVHARARLCT